MPILRHLLLPALCGLLAMPAHAAEVTDRDPWEGFNRKVFAFNEFMDRWIAKPVARGYQAVTPERVDHAVTHFFNNLGEVINVTNFALQGEGRQAADSTVRFVANSTFGVGGLFDVATAGGIPYRDTGFGTTLGKWGVGSGPYLVLPFLGASTVRETVALPADWTVGPLPEPLTAFPHVVTRYTLEGLYIIDTRADLLEYEQAVVGDRYGFLRDIYLQRRDFEVNGETAGDPFLDEDFSE